MPGRQAGGTGCLHGMSCQADGRACGRQASTGQSAPMPGAARGLARRPAFARRLLAVGQRVVHLEELGLPGAARQAEHPRQRAAAGVERAAGHVVVELAGDEDLLGAAFSTSLSSSVAVRSPIRVLEPAARRGTPARRGWRAARGSGRFPPGRARPWPACLRAAHRVGEQQARWPGRAGRRRRARRPRTRAGPGPGRARCGPPRSGCAAGRGGWPARRRRSPRAPGEHGEHDDRPGHRTSSLPAVITGRGLPCCGRARPSRRRSARSLATMPQS